MMLDHGKHTYRLSHLFLIADLLEQCARKRADNQ